jgi:hypothetical protein
MTRLLEMAVEAARQLSPEEQDELARTILEIVDAEFVEPVRLTPEQKESIRVSREQAARGEFASDAEIEAIWARYI